MFSPFEYQNVSFGDVNKVMHNDKAFAVVFKTRKRFTYDSQIFDMSDLACHVHFSYDIMPYRKSAEDGVKVGATGVVANLQNKSETHGESFGDFFRYIATAFDNIGMNPESDRIVISFGLFDKIHEYHIFSWDAWVEIDKVNRMLDKVRKNNRD